MVCVAKLRHKRSAKAYTRGKPKIMLSLAYPSADSESLADSFLIDAFAVLDLISILFILFAHIWTRYSHSQGVRLAQKFEALVLADNRFEIPAPRHLGTLPIITDFPSLANENSAQRENARLTFDNNRANDHFAPWLSIFHLWYLIKWNTDVRIMQIEMVVYGEHQVLLTRMPSFTSYSTENGHRPHALYPHRYVHVYFCLSFALSQNWHRQNPCLLFTNGNPIATGMVVFRIKGENDLTERLLKRLNHRGYLHCVPASLKGKYVIRYGNKHSQFVSVDQMPLIYHHSY